MPLPRFQIRNLGNIKKKVPLVVKSAIRLGINDEQISHLTGLSVDKIKEIRKDL